MRWAQSDGGSQARVETLKTRPNPGAGAPGLSNVHLSVTGIAPNKKAAGEGGFGDCKKLQAAGLALDLILALTAVFLRFT